MAKDLEKIELSEDPFTSFRRWMSAAEQSGAKEPTAMTLATASRDGRPSARIVLYKGTSRSRDGSEGFRLFTNFDSPKSRQMSENPHAALVFFWAEAKRQIRVEGRVEHLEDSESDAYFKSRPLGSRIGAWASPQSQRLKSRAELLKRVEDIEQKFANGQVPRPPNWGGWILIPESIEFWQAGENRLHDRFLFERDGNDGWRISRLAP